MFVETGSAFRRAPTENSLMAIDHNSGHPSRREPSHIPNLYPGLDPLQLERFLTDPKYVHIKSFDNVYILPFVSRKDERTQMAFGLGLSRLMIRNLMLLRDISIHGPEDTAQVPYEAIDDLVESHQRSWYVTGIANFDSDGYSLQVELHRPDRPVKEMRVRHDNFRAFLGQCSRAIARLLGSSPNDRITQAWTVGQPRDARSLVRCGKIHLDLNRQQLAERAQAAQDLLDSDPDFVVAVWDVDEEVPGALRHYVPGLKRDPYNAQLCFLTFIALWTSKGPQPEALQFCRKAIELSPGHGKAHMCAPHAAQRPVEMLRHSELGYRLLPGNSFAVNNYTLALTRANAPAAKRIELAEEGIEADPRDPSNYDRLIELYRGLEDYRAALAIAERLQELYEPEMDERALYCLRQNPRRAQLIDSGEYDPAAENRRRIAELRRLVRGGKERR
jgi:tetratricopeptide (TPR) repeat protein